jgi:hypothetical protein
MFLTQNACQVSTYSGNNPLLRSWALPYIILFFKKSVLARKKQYAQVFITFMEAPLSNGFHHHLGGDFQVILQPYGILALLWKGHELLYIIVSIWM